MPLVIVGGTGRNYSVSIAKLLNDQPNSRFTHEAEPQLSWIFKRHLLHAHYQRFEELSKEYEFYGDVACPWLNYAELIIEENPDAKFLFFRRDREETIESWMAKIGDEWNHWSADTKWKSAYHDCFPTYHDIDDKREAIAKYYDEYYERAEYLGKKLPKNVKVFESEAINSEEGQDEIFKFVGMDDHVHQKATRLNSGPKHDNKTKRALAEMDDRESILIATPNMGFVRTESVLNLISWFVSKRYKLAFAAPVGNIPHDRARNIVAKDYLENYPDYNYIFWMDAKTVPSMDILEHLLAADKPMISATAQTFKETTKGFKALVPTSFRWDEKMGTYKTCTSGGGVEEVDITHVACTLIRRDVMEAVNPPWFQFGFRDDEGTVLVGEEFSFSQKVTDAGYKIYNHFGLLAHHFVTTDTALINHLIVKAHNNAVKSTYEAIKDSGKQTGKIVTPR